MYGDMRGYSPCRCSRSPHCDSASRMYPTLLAPFTLLSALSATVLAMLTSL